ncbi:MAG: GNAT family N-acetyltransferase [Eubacteriales bacterium]|nr:GNAT family N-acetyltransferase [Eubacteriales bacterium]
MKKAASVFLRKDIKAEDIRKLIGWLQNENIIRYLNESRFATDSLLYLLDNVQPHLLTLYFNQKGRFYLVCGKHNPDIAIGFIRLLDLPDNRYEVVYVIGEEQLWGRGFGKAALREALNILFFENRAKAVSAKINRKNIRSVHMATHCGMRAVKTGESITEYSMTFEEYLKKAGTCEMFI